MLKHNSKPFFIYVARKKNTFKGKLCYKVMGLNKDEKDRIFQSMLKEHMRLLKLYERRLHYLETRNEDLELCRMLKYDSLTDEAKQDLVDTYTKHFNDKIASIKYDIEQIMNRNEEYIAD